MDALEQGQLPQQIRFTESVNLINKRERARDYIDKDLMLYAHNLRWKLHFKRKFKDEKQSHARVVRLSDFAPGLSTADLVVDKGDK